MEFADVVFFCFKSYSMTLSFAKICVVGDRPMNECGALTE
jgi:hypothetical protein